MGISLSAALAPNVGNGKMAAMRQVSIKSFVTHLDALAKTRKLNEQELQLKTLSDIAQNVLNAHYVSIYGQEPEPESFSRVNLGSFKDCFLNSIHMQSDWKSNLSKAALEKITRNRVTLEKSFGLNSYTWAWFQLQLGEKESAKKSLNALYENEFLRVMALKDAVFGFGSTPMGEAEFIYKALSPMADNAEQEDLNQKMQKMKAHVSNLPQSKIMT